MRFRVFMLFHKALLVPEDLCPVQQHSRRPALAHDARKLEEYFAVEKCVYWRTIHEEEGDHELSLFDVTCTC
jgi:hypothetical protein